MLRVVAAIANGGDILRPHLVHEIRDPTGNIVPAGDQRVVRHLNISPQNLEIMRQAMSQVVESGSAPAARVPGVRIAGKSGTAEYGAQLSSPSGEAANGTYNEHGWFVSYAPFENPQVALVVFHERGGGAATAAPTTSRIWDYYFHQYLPSRPASPTSTPTRQP
jgi:penicillin-binding protein 2